MTENKKNKRLKDLNLIQQEWELNEYLRSILELFLGATTVLSGQKYPTMPLCYYIFCLLSHFLTPTSNDHPIVVALKQSLE